MKPKPIRVRVIARKDKATFVLRWRDPVTGRTREQATDIEKAPEKRRLAEEAAAAKAEELNALVAMASDVPVLTDGDSLSPDGDLLWTAFDAKYREEYISSLAPKSLASWRTTVSRVVEIINPKYVSDINAAALSRWTAALRNGTKEYPPVREATIACYLRTLLGGLRWAERIGLIAQAPKWRPPKRAKGFSQMMRGRPITPTEFERIIKAVELVRPNDPEKWQFLLKGLWWGGLRIGEAVALTWDEGPLTINTSGKYPVFRVLAEAEKGHKDRLLPIAPEFVRLLETVPPAERVGPVFKLGVLKLAVGKVICDIGKAARVKVNDRGKFASAHDYRRSFGTRWAMRLQPIELKDLMRHETVETTMKFYVSLDAQTLAEKLWKATDQESDPL